VFDEPAHIAAGLSYVQTGEVRANPQHPPLLKELEGLSLRLSGVRLPDSPEIQRMLAGEGGETGAGNALISRNGPDRVLFWARMPLVLLSGFLGLLIYLWGRRIVGPVAALAALFLWALDPTLLAHSFLVTMDAGLAVFTLLFVFALWNYVVRPDTRRLVWCGLALGAALSAKFSGLVLLPVAAALLLAAVRWPPQAAPDSAPPVARSYAGGAGALAIMCLLAILVIQALYLSPDGLYLYSTGLQRVNADHDPAYLVFLAGRMQHQFLSYFAVAYLLKEPIPILLLTGIGLAALLRGKTVPPLAKLFLLLPPAVLFAAHTLWADNLGVRYIIPMLPFAYLIAGAGAAWLLQHRARWARPLAAVLGLWLVATAIGIYPDHLAYFNEAACLPGTPAQIGMDGGTRCGPMWLDDSNVDWGQGLKQMKQWMDRNAKGR
jgi:4-amino-4-deoxy-L-arabinose transferase-like glycosyltransferase